MKFWEEKCTYLFRHQKGKCAISGEPMSLSYKIDLDHYRIHNKQNLRIKHPLAIDSLLNLRAVLNSHHIGSTSKGKAYGDARQRWLEDFMSRHPKIALWANQACCKLFTNEPYEDFGI